MLSWVQTGLVFTDPTSQSGATLEGGSSRHIPPTCVPHRGTHPSHCRGKKLWAKPRGSHMGIPAMWSPLGHCGGLVPRVWMWAKVWLGPGIGSTSANAEPNLQWLKNTRDKHVSWKGCVLVRPCGRKYQWPVGDINSRYCLIYWHRGSWLGPEPKAKPWLCCWERQGL